MLTYYIIFVSLFIIGSSQELTKELYCKDCFVLEYYEFWILLFISFCFIIQLFVMTIILYRYCVILRQYNNNENNNDDNNILNLPI